MLASTHAYEEFTLEWVRVADLTEPTNPSYVAKRLVEEIALDVTDGVIVTGMNIPTNEELEAEEITFIFRILVTPEDARYLAADDSYIVYQDGKELS